MSVVADVDVVICAWAGDDRRLTCRAIAAAAKQAAPGHVHLVDMSPARDLVELAASIPGVVVHHVPRSSGLGESRQVGIAHATSRYVAFLDSDALPRPGWLAALRAAVGPDDVAIAGGPVLPVWPATRRPRLFASAAAGDFLSMLDLGDVPLDVPRVLPGNMIVDRRRTGEAVFSRHLGRSHGALLGAEEIDTMLRMTREGWRIVYAPGAAVDHRTASERMSWRWMWRRVYAAGRESALSRHRLEPLPRRVRLRDRAFLAAVALPYLAGRYRATRRD